MNEAKAWSIVGVAAALALAGAIFSMAQCDARGRASKAEACKAVMQSNDERARLLAVASGGVCNGYQ